MRQPATFRQPILTYTPPVKKPAATFQPMVTFGPSTSPPPPPPPPAPDIEAADDYLPPPPDVEPWTPPDYYQAPVAQAQAPEKKPFPWKWALLGVAVLSGGVYLLTRN